MESPSKGELRTLYHLLSGFCLSGFRGGGEPAARHWSCVGTRQRDHGLSGQPSRLGTRDCLPETWWNSTQACGHWLQWSVCVCVWVWVCVCLCCVCVCACVLAFAGVVDDLYADFWSHWTLSTRKTGPRELIGSSPDNSQRTPSQTHRHTRGMHATRETASQLSADLSACDRGGRHF